MADEDMRKFMQIGFAALLARKEAVQKQYIYERRGDNDGFTFEPILRNNEPELADEEYMRKKYYSQMVYQGAKDGRLETSINEGDPNKRAARRFWAGRKGTGWNGTGKGGYMESLQPGIPETKGTGLGSAKVESDHLMQAYLEQQKGKMHILKGKSQLAAADLFSLVAENANRVTGVVDLSSQEMVPSFKELGLSYSQFENYITPHMGSEISSQPEWAKKAIRKFNASWKKYGRATKNMRNFVYTSYGFLQHEYAQKLLDSKLSEDPTKYQYYKNRLLAVSYDRPGGDEGVTQRGAPYTDYDTVPGFTDFDPDFTELDMGVSRVGPSKNEGSDFTGDGGHLIANNMEVSDPRMLRAVFEKKSLDQMFPKAFQEYQKGAKMDPQKVLSDPKVSSGIMSVPQAKNFIRWMVKTVNDELKQLNEIIPEPYVPKSMWRTSVEGMEALGKFPKGFGSGYSETAKFLGGLEGYGRGGVKDFKSEIVQGFMSDFGVLNDEARYLMSNRFGQIKGESGSEWGWQNVDREKRGVDLHIPLKGGLLRVSLNVRIVPEGPRNRPYAEIYIPFKSRQFGTEDGIHFIPDVPMTFQEYEIASMKGEEVLKAHQATTAEFWKTGIGAQYLGMTMATQTGEAARMFMGDFSPAQSVAFFTSAISVADFAQQLKALVDTGAETWWGEPDGFGGFFDLHSMEGGAFKQWAMKWSEESNKLQHQVNNNIEAEWKEWVATYAGGGVTAAPPSLARAWAGPVRLGPFIHSTKYRGQAQNVGRRPHGYYVQGDWEGGPMVG
jgi:hypothetical protein